MEEEEVQEEMQEATSSSFFAFFCTGKALQVGIQLVGFPWMGGGAYGLFSD